MILLVPVPVPATADIIGTTTEPEYAAAWLFSEFKTYEQFTTTNLPLALSSDSSMKALYNGISAVKQPIYKVNGNLWAVTFNSALGDVNAMTATGTKYLTAGTSLSVYDNVVEGLAS